jgi:hypothetical protein
VRYGSPFIIHTNTLEGNFSVFKRGMKGVYQHCSESTCTATLPSSTSATTTALRSGWTIRIGPPALTGVKGKRLTYSHGSWGQT